MDFTYNTLYELKYFVIIMIKKIIKIKEFNPFTDDLNQEYLIEASAGTGKTFTIIIIYLRFLLGLYKKNETNIPLSVEEILVVTFTDVSTQDLCKRIKNSINILRIACIKGTSPYSIINKFLKKIKNLQEANLILLKAELNFHNATILTIHSFCQKILNLKNYEINGFVNNKKLINNEIYLQNNASVNFWRKYLYPLPKNIAQIVLQYWKTPSELINKLLPFLLKNKLPKLKYHFNNISLIKQFYKNIKYIKIFKKEWIKYNNDIINVIIKSDINKHIYNNRSIKFWIEYINQWVINNVEDNFIPEQLKRFSQKVLISKTINKKNFPKHILFKKIDIFLNKIISLKILIIIKAIKYIKFLVKKNKEKNEQISFNDLLLILNKSLSNCDTNKNLAQDIRKLYPVALIDEFQDTDIQQYDIFKKIYINQSNCTLILIGDPKQAIYSFRGADIFTYIKASLEIKNRYTLKNNWRSSKTMVNSVNKIFSNQTHPFFFKNIIFHPTSYVKQKLNYNFIINNIIQPGITFWFLPKETNLNLYKQKISYQCAYEICQWLILGQQKKIFFKKNKNHKNIINISDIVVLVRNKYEANIIQKEFIKFNIPSIYLSNSNSVFETIEAKELVLLLQSILEPHQVKRLKNILASNLFNIDLSNFDYKKEKYFLEKIINQFIKYRNLWNKYGILLMLENIFLKKNILFKTNIINNTHKKKIQNILHIAELIEIEFIKIKDKKQIIIWLLKQITFPNNRSVDQQIRLENDSNQIRIITIHKAKGLQFPLVWIPFIASNFLDLINNEGIIYHDRKTLKTIIDFKKDDDSIKHALEELLSENLRLLYVSLTRSIFHCSIGIGIIKNNKKKYQKYLPYQSAIEFLINNKNNVCYNNFKNSLYSLINQDIQIKILTKKKQIQYNPICSIKEEDKNKYFNELKINKYKTLLITSYSIIKNNLNINNNIYQYKFLNSKKKYIKKTPHTFPTGKEIGIILHNIFEKLDFTQKISYSFIKKEFCNKEINPSWYILLIKWLTNILNHPLGMDNIILSKIENKNKKTELEFYLTIKNKLCIIEFNKIICQYDNISKKLPILNNNIQGILKGFIDLVFLWNNKYYLIDYKSNWLGKDYAKYTKKYIEKNICLNRYDLQYQIYTLALHKYLSFRIKNYNYKEHFGSVLYLYIRGINNFKNNSNGIWEIKPSYKLIEKLDKLIF
ncbi:exodeoxyribonuclease V subunit beta [Enterobacteriaceae endosymbiont of Plateumaris sericea]|uniref:exodeoxyribonuclease V subunit beta n=1 Tax=Enterobacteriaceae endosymbiont of Plateumaris sericea TaxID=2675797 RepID=UPI001448F6EE|nr:exodeoxyribonuclease V subunit beta [Enterobacteriaceae endosymbiont of Plateumaris sericea]QJC30142.1 exodeoxyribonuclease V subunit beta [Enterobacteriaceae endosymbiont of Plateumaris sericea]